MTQLERYAQMMKVDLGPVRAKIGYSVTAEGSVLAQTIRARVDKIAIHYDLQSDEGPERVAGADAQRPQRLLRPPVHRPTGPLRGLDQPKRQALQHRRLPAAGARVTILRRDDSETVIAR